MPYPRSRLVALRIALGSTLLPFSLNAQVVDSLRPVIITRENAGDPITVLAIVGLQTARNKEVGSFLTANGFENNLHDHGLSGGELAAGYEVLGGINRWLIVTGVRLELSSRSRATDISMNMWGLRLGTGYQLLRPGRFQMHPLFGLGVQFSNLSINEGEANSFSGLFADTAARNFAFTNHELHLSAGLGFEYELFKLKEDDFHASSVTVGLRGEYEFGLWDAWSRPGSGGMQGGPDMGLRGFNLWLTMGLKLRPKIYDARIVAEKIPEGEVEGEKE